MIKKRKALIVVVGFIALIGLAWLTGWGLHALWARLQAPQSSPTLTTTPSPTRQPTPAPPSQTTETPTPTQETAQATSTVAPTTSPTPKSTRVTVQDGDGLYAVCRRYCPGRFKQNDVEPELIRYAQQIAEYNGKPWNSGNPELTPGEELKMLSCPP